MTISRTDSLSKEQQFGADWLEDRPGSYLADPPGFGKTRQLLAACEDDRAVTVVCPAAIRDAKVWEREAKLIGFDRPVTTLSYHQLMGKKDVIAPGGALIFDEAHRLKSRKVSWSKASMNGAAVSTRTHLASGTPTPNGDLTELYGQMRLINPEIPASYWKWAERWFVITTTQYTQYHIDGTLLGCVGNPCWHPSTPDCVHRQEFWAANVGDLMLRRPEELLDLPDMVGFDHPMDTPMTATQRRVYNDLKRDLLAEIPEDGVTLEALNDSAKFVQLWQAATGLSSVDPEADDKHSGKRVLIEEMLADREHPVVLGVYFRNSAAAMGRLCKEMGLSYAMYGASTPKKDQVVEEFQRGGIDVLVASIMVVREGITLTAADQVILAERSWVPGDNEQTVRRVRRRGQTKTVGVRQLVTPKSVDTYQWKALNEKDFAIRRSMSRAEVAKML